MKVLIYVNKEKDNKRECLALLVDALKSHSIDYKILEDEDLVNSESADALFSIGGDGTILFLAEFSKRNSIPIIGINAGKLGFLCEFEKNEINLAVENLVNHKFKKDKRLMLKVIINNQSFYALNDIYIQRTYEHNVGNLVADISVNIDRVLVSKYKGDGAIISSPTGSTAYSFSLGGPLVSPHTAAFVVTPIAAHSFNQRPIVYSAGSTCKISVSGKAKTGVFVDGKFVGQLDDDNPSVEVLCAEKPLVFLRDAKYNFFMNLSNKLNNKGAFNE